MRLRERDSGECNRRIGIEDNIRRRTYGRKGWKL
jgi:hypothetical protein